MAKSKLTLPADGQDVVTYTDGVGDHQQVVVLVLEDGTLLPGDGTSGIKVDPGADNDVTITSGTVTLAAGSAAIGKLAANSGVDIGDVDVKSIAAGTALIGKVTINDGTTDASVSATGGANEGLHTMQIDANGDELGYPPPVYSSLTPTQSTSPAYGAGDCIGGDAFALASAVQSSGGTGHLLSITVIDKDDLTHSGAAGQYIIHLFSQDPGSPGSDNAAYALAGDTQLGYYVGSIDTENGDWYDHGPGKACAAYPTKGPIPYRCVGSTSLYFVITQKYAASGVASASGLVIVPHVVLD